MNIYEDFAQSGSIFFDVISREQYWAYVYGIQRSDPCILVNYNDDPFRQRFSAAHEVAHAIFDLESEDFIISFSQWNKQDLENPGEYLCL